MIKEENVWIEDGSKERRKRDCSDPDHININGKKINHPPSFLPPPLPVGPGSDPSPLHHGPSQDSHLSGPPS